MKIQDLGQALNIDIPAIVPIMLIIYMVGILAVGLWAASKVKSSEDWFVGGRSMGPWITALAHGSSSLGGGTYIAGPQYGWEAGASALWAAPGDVFGPLLNFGIIARRMRRYTEKAKSLTIPEFFGHRYYSNGVRTLSTVILVIAMLISLIVEYLAMGVLVSAITGWSFVVSLMIGYVIIMVYTGAGGYLAVAYTDFVQSILMIIGLLILIPVCVHNVGGLTGMNHGLASINEGLATLWGEDYYLKGAPLMIAGIALVYFIGYMGQPHLVIKTVAIKDDASIRRVPMIGACFGFLLAFGTYGLGMVGRVAYPDISMLPGGNAEYVMPMLALSNLPPVLAGFLLAGACAAVMSTASALILVIGSTVGNDLFGQFRKDASEQTKMKVTKLSTYALGIISVLLCFIPIFQIGVYQVTWIAWSVLSPAFIPSIVGGLYWKNGNKAGSIASMISGAVVGFGWYYTLQPITNIHCFFAALVISIVVYIVVSKLTKKPPQEIQDFVDYARSFEEVDGDVVIESGVQMSEEQFAKVIKEEKTEKKIGLSLEPQGC